MTSAQLQVDGHAIHVEGDGPDTLMMIHGWPDTYRLWDRQVALLRDQFRCVRFTLPGFEAGAGKAPQPDELLAFFRKVADAVSPARPVTLLLHDWGCVFGYAFAARHPDRVARVVGVDIGDSWSRDFLRSLSGKAKGMIVFYQLWLALAWKIGGRLGDRMTRWMAGQLRYRAAPLSEVGARMNYPYAQTWTGRLKRLPPFVPHCPVLYLYGTRKPFRFHSPQWLQQLETMPGSRTVALDAGHWIMVDAPEAFDAAVADWLGAGRRPPSAEADSA